MVSTGRAGQAELPHRQRDRDEAGSPWCVTPAVAAWSGGHGRRTVSEPGARGTVSGRRQRYVRHGDWSARLANLAPTDWLTAASR